MRFALLGPLAVVDDAGGQIAVPGPRVRALLAALLVHANTLVGAETLVEAVWDTRPPPAARETLRSYVRRLRRALEPQCAGRIVTRDQGFLIRLAPAELDVLEFEALCRNAADALREQSWALAAHAAERALELWRGEPLHDVPSQVLREALVLRFEPLRLQACEDRVEAQLHLGQHARLVPQLHELTSDHPLREHFHAQLITALAACGRRAEALAAYQQARQVLVDELGIEPGPELRALHERILAGEADPVRSQNAAPRETGPARTVPRQLPPAVSHFTGRQAELDTLSRLLDEADLSGGTVVISAIDGMAGIGKTALAIHAAHRLADRFPDGQLFIDLHGYTEGYAPRSPVAALATLLRGLGATTPQLAGDVEELAAGYRQRLADSRTLVVLDNAADEAQVRPLIPGAAGCLALITSRRRLRGLHDAHAVQLDVLDRADAVAVLRAVAGPDRVAAEDPAVAELAELCGGLPLALRIAAALLRHRPQWDVGHVVELMRDERRRAEMLDRDAPGLSALLDLSYRNLEEPEQDFFRHLGLMPGPDLEAHATAALGGTTADQAASLLERLVDHNLVAPDAPTRYHIHDLIRSYAHGLAGHDPAGPDGAQAEAAVHRLLDYYQDAATRAEHLIARYPRPDSRPDSRPTATVETSPAPSLPDSASAWAWLRAERRNLLAAIDHAAARAEHGRVHALTAGIATMLRTDGPWPEADARHTASVAAAREVGDPAALAQALLSLGEIRLFIGDFAGTEAALDEAITVSRACGDIFLEAVASSMLGGVSRLAGGPPQGLRHLERALALFRELGDRKGQANTLAKLGDVRGLLGDPPAGLRDLREALALFQDLGDRYGQGKSLALAADIRLVTSDYERGLEDLDRALALFRELGDRQAQANVLRLSGSARTDHGDHAAALPELLLATELYEAVDDPIGRANSLASLGSARAATDDPDGALRDLRHAIELVRSTGARANEPTALNRYARVLATIGESDEALTNYRDALSIARELDLPHDEVDTLEGIGDCQLRAGQTEAGTATLARALYMYESLGRKTDAERLRARLNARC